MSLVEQKLKIKNFTVANRLVYPPMITQMSSDKDLLTEENIQYYENYAKDSGFGMIISEIHYVDIRGKTRPKQLSFASDEVIPYEAELVRRMKSHGVAVVAQLGLCGAIGEIYGKENIAPSAIERDDLSKDFNYLAEHVLTKEEIIELEDAFADGAERVKKAGYDAVLIMAGHGRLLNQFLSPLTNFRTDEYGGSIENRGRFVLEIIQKVRAKVGDDYPIFLRLGGVDYHEGGNTVEDAVWFAKQFVDAGVDLMDITGGTCGPFRRDDPTPGFFREESAAIKRAVNVPVLLTGGVNHIEEAEQLLEAGAADLIGVGRAALRNRCWASDEFKRINLIEREEK